MKHFTLACGRRVSVDAVYCQRTYLSLILGRPDKEWNDNIVERVKAGLVPLWGKRRVHVVPPAINDSDPSHPVLPPLVFTAWLQCHKPIQPKNAGSELVVVWFRGECDGQSFAQALEEGIRDLAWDQLAQDFAAY